MLDIFGVSMLILLNENKCWNLRVLNLILSQLSYDKELLIS